MNQPMPSDSREALRKLVRGGSGQDKGLRRTLLDGLRAATQSTYQLQIDKRSATSLRDAALRDRKRLDSVLGSDHAQALDTLIEQAAYTWMHKLVVLRILEAQGLRKPLLSQGRKSAALSGWRAFFPTLPGDETEGLRLLLELVFEDLADQLPGLFGRVGHTDLVPMPAPLLFECIQAINDPALEPCWLDDTCLGWIYQYWNDPAREALDAKLNDGGKVARDELASKTQMFTERYMVEWLLQNSLNQQWLAICERHGWTADARSVLDALETRRVDWRQQRDAGQVELTELMPLHTELEQRWAYWVPQPLPQDAIDKAPESLDDFKLIDPACGSGHFLVIALDHLVALHQEEDRHRGRTRSLRRIVNTVLEDNLHGVDLDPRAVQIAAAALWLKARAVLQAEGDTAPLQLRRLNLLATQLDLGRLPPDAPARQRLRQVLETEVGISGSHTDELLKDLQDADHRGSLLKVGQTITDIVGRAGDLLSAPGFTAGADRQANTAQAAERLVEALEDWLDRHTRRDDLGLRLHGEQLAVGVRFVRMMQEGQYDLVVANPPYQGTSKIEDAGFRKYINKHYAAGKADLYAVFLLRGLELVRPGGVSGMLTMRNWMFIKTYAGLREKLLGEHSLRALHDLSSGAFDEINPAQVVVSVVSSIFGRGHDTTESIGLKVFDDDTVTTQGETQRKRAATLCHAGRHSFEPAALKVVPEWPLVYWWGASDIELFKNSKLFGDVAPARQGLITGDMTRFLRCPHEVAQALKGDWVPYIYGAKGREWIDPVVSLVRWGSGGLEVQCFERNGRQASRPQNQSMYFVQGVAFAMIGSTFSARVHRGPSIFGDKGSSVFPEDLQQATCSMNTTRAKRILESFNPSVSFQSGDVNRLPLIPVSDSRAIFKELDASFSLHESHREPSVEYLSPGPSAWTYAQDWAQRAVDRPEGAPLPPWEPVYEPEPPTDHLSYALGLALGRFKPLNQVDLSGPEPDLAGGDPPRNAIVDPTVDSVDHALPDGILFLSSFSDQTDDLSHPACAPLREAWTTHGPAIDHKKGLHDWLRTRFFGDVHRSMYENRPIHWPLSSAKKSFVVWVTIHRMGPQTLRTVLLRLTAEYESLQARLDSLRAQRDAAEGAELRKAERELERITKLNDELAQFIVDVRQCAEKGPLVPPKAKCPEREVDAPYDPNLDDGVMINSAALWALLEPQWKDPKKWWKELASAKGRKDYDWSHLAARYFPTRVDAKCKKDPSLGVAHGCFWRYHPARAWAWELRLGLEIEPGFTIDESDSDACREAFIRDCASDLLDALEKEVKRRHRKDKELPELVVDLPVAGVWALHGKALLSLERSLSLYKSHRKPVRFEEPGGGRQAWLDAHPKQAQAQAQALAGILPRQTELLP